MEQTDRGRAGADGTAKNLSDRVRSLRLGDRDASSAPRRQYGPWIVAFVLLLTTVAFAVRAHRAGAEADAKKRTDTTEPSSVASVGEVVLQAKGYVTPISLVQVSPKVGGQLVWIHERFCEGQKFEKGQELARIEAIDYQAEHDQALYAHKAAWQRYEEIKKTQPEEIKQAEAELDEARNNTTQLKLDLDRNRRLSAGNAVAQRDIEQVRFSYRANAARVKRLESSLRMIRDGRQDARLQAVEFDMRQARGVLDKAVWRLKNTIVVAPISGTILTKKAELGDIVNPSAYSSGISASLCGMANLRQLEIDLSIQERDIAAVKEGQPCQVMPEAYQNDDDFLARHPKGYVGKVSRLMPTAPKGAVSVRVLILDIPEAEEGKYLRPDMGALVSFLRMPKTQSSEKDHSSVVRNDRTSAASRSGWVTKAR